MTDAVMTQVASQDYLRRSKQLNVDMQKLPMTVLNYNTQPKDIKNWKKRSLVKGTTRSSSKSEKAENLDVGQMKQIVCLRQHI